MLLGKRLFLKRQSPINKLTLYQKKIVLLMKSLFLTSVFFYFIFSACGEDQPQKSLPNAQEVYLDGTQTLLKLPKHFKRSSRYRLKEDLPHLAKNASALATVQNSLEMLEFDDDAIDIFIDTISKFHQIIILDFEHTPLDKETGALLNNQIKESYIARELVNPGLKTKRLSAQMKGGNTLTFYKFKYKIEETILESNVHYSTTYLLTATNRSYAIFEVSETEDDLEQYLWALKE